MCIQCACGAKYSADNAAAIEHFRSDLHMKWNEWALLRAAKQVKVAIPVKLPTPPPTMNAEEALKFRSDFHHESQRILRLFKTPYKQRIRCGCGSAIKKVSLYDHVRSTKHRQWKAANGQ